MAAKKTKVTMIQGKDGQVRRVRVNGSEFAVLNAGPTLIAGKIGVSLTIADVDLDGEEEAADASGTTA